MEVMESAPLRTISGAVLNGILWAVLINSTHFLIGHLPVSLVFRTQINFVNSCCLCQKMNPFSTKILKNQSWTAFRIQGFVCNETLKEKIQTLACDNEQFLYDILMVL